MYSRRSERGISLKVDSFSISDAAVLSTVSPSLQLLGVMGHVGM